MDDDIIWSQIITKCLRLAVHSGGHSLSTLRAFKVDYLSGRATLAATEVEGQGKGKEEDKKEETLVVVNVRRADGSVAVLRAENVLLATGSSPMALPAVPFDHARIFDSDSIARLAFLPRSVCIMGSGIVAIEFAKIFRDMGCSVTMTVRGSIAASLARIGLDSDMASRLSAALRASGVAILEKTTVASFGRCSGSSNKSGGGGAKGGEGSSWRTKEGAPLLLALSDGSTLCCDVFMAAAGRSPNTAWLRGGSNGNGGEENGSLAVALSKRGHVQTVGDGSESGGAAAEVGGEGLRSRSHRRIWAAGDLLAPPSPALASTAAEQGAAAVAAMFGEEEQQQQSSSSSSSSSSSVWSSNPVGMWTTPECSYFGLTLTKAKEQGIDAEEGTASYGDCLRGRVFSPEGLLKIVFDTASGVIVGVHCIGADACELIHFGMRLVKEKATLESVINAMFVAVTYHELFKAAALNGNSKLMFGVQWLGILATIKASLGASSEDLKSSIEDGSLRTTFNSLDTDGSGALEVDEVLSVMRTFGGDERLTRGAVANLVRLADENGNGSIDYEEFEGIARRLSGLISLTSRRQQPAK